MNPDSRWLHPLSKCIVEPLNSNIPCDHYFSPKNAPVVWNLDVYMIDNDNHALRWSERNTRCELLKYSTTNDSWSNFPITCHGHDHVLAVYHSKLLMINEDGGDIQEFDNTNFTFKKSHDISCLVTQSGKVVAAGSEGKYLLVVCQREDTTLASIAIFDGNDWLFRSGPYLYDNSSEMVQVIIHNSTVFLAELKHLSVPIVHKTPLQVLLDDATCAWQLFDSALPVLSKPFNATSNLVIFNNRLHIASYHHGFGLNRVIILWHYSESGCIEVGRGTGFDLWWIHNFFLFHSQIHDGGVMLMSGLKLIKLVPQGTIVLWQYFKICVYLMTAKLCLHYSGGL